MSPISRWFHTTPLWQDKRWTGIKTSFGAKEHHELLRKIIYALNQTDLAELELARVEPGKKDQEAINVTIEHNIKVMNKAERSTLMLLSGIIHAQNMKIIIIPEDPEKSFDVLRDPKKTTECVTEPENSQYNQRKSLDIREFDYPL